MQDNSSLVSNQAAFIFVLLLASANLASANPICAECRHGTADSSSKKVVDYNVQISESGENFNETIEVDTEKQTELFKVPAHNNVDHSNILHDFKTNMSMLLLPEKKICYLLPLDKELSAPRKLISDLDKAQKTFGGTAIIDNKWTVGSKVTDRSVLSDELAIFCQYPIYNVRKLEDSMTATRIQTSQSYNRKRRQDIVFSVIVPDITDEDLGDLLCDGGQGSPSGDEIWDCHFNQKKEWKVKCTMTRTCYYVDVCDSLSQCLERHIRSNIYCCEYVCI